MTDNFKVYTPLEAAEALKLTRRTLYNYLKSGQLKATKIGRGWRITQKNLEDFVAGGAEVEEANRYRGTRKPKGAKREDL